jgi:hypothetical protein
MHQCDESLAADTYTHTDASNPKTLETMLPSRATHMRLPSRRKESKRSS